MNKIYIGVNHSIEAHRRHSSTLLTSLDTGACFIDASKVRRRTWKQSVQGAVATWSVISMRYFLTILDSLR